MILLPTEDCWDGETRHQPQYHPDQTVHNRKFVPKKFSNPFFLIGRLNNLFGESLGALMVSFDNKWPFPTSMDAKVAWVMAYISWL